MTEAVITEITPGQYSVFIPLTLKKRGGCKMICVPEEQELYEQQSNYEPALVKAVVRAHLFQQQLDNGKYNTIDDLATAHKIMTRHAQRIMKLNFLAPSVKASILRGIQPAQFKLEDIINLPIPMLWHEQETKWGFKSNYKISGS